MNRLKEYNNHLNHCPRAPHGGHGPHGEQDRPPHPRGRLTDNPRYQADSVDGKLLAVLRALGHASKHMDGKGGQTRVLRLLREEGEMTQRALTQALGIQPGSASEILAKLEQAGFILRTPSVRDRRTSDVALTEIGRRRADEAAAREAAHREKLFSTLTEEERTKLLSMLEGLYRSWEGKDRRAGE